MSNLHFHFLTGDINWQEYGGKFISKRLNNGDWDYWLVLEVCNMQEATGDEDAEKYAVMLCAVSPAAAGQEQMDKAWESYGMDETLDKWQEGLPQRLKEEFMVEVLNDYGIHALIWQDSGNNLAKLLKAAHHEADAMGSLFFGFAMDRAQNRIGSTGWDCISGNILAGLDRMAETMGGEAE